MTDSRSHTTVAYSVSRSRGKQIGELLCQSKVRAARKARGKRGPQTNRDLKRISGQVASRFSSWLAQLMRILNRCLDAVQVIQS